MINMNKKDLAKIVAENEEIPVTEALDRVDSVLLAIVEANAKLAEGEPEGKKAIRGKLTLVGFGSFIVRDIPERTYRNPKSGGNVVKPRRNEASFKPGKALEESV